jgi:hypothetical protein
MLLEDKKAVIYGAVGTVGRGVARAFAVTVLEPEHQEEPQEEAQVEPETIEAEPPCSEAA